MQYREQSYLIFNQKMIYYACNSARLAKLANALGLGPSAERLVGSSPTSRTIFTDRIFEEPDTFSA